MVRPYPTIPERGALCFSYSHDAEIYAGPKLRYRYWFNPSLSQEAGAGPLWRLSYLKSGTFFASQLGVNYRDLATLFLQLDFFENTIPSLGIKIGSWPGTIVAIVAAGVAGVRYLIERID